jgi:molybdenum cofactor guanylyltransferase
VDRGVSALILAGGEGRRFGGDKLAAVWRGRTLLDGVIATCSNLCDDVLVLGPSTGRQEVTHIDRGIRLLSDASPFAGPLMALVDGLGLAMHPHCLVVAADMPAISTSVVDSLLAELASSPSLALVALKAEGRAQPVPAALRVAAALRYLAPLTEHGERRLSVLLGVPGARLLPAEELFVTPPASVSLRDVDTTEDLAALPA